MILGIPADELFLWLLYVVGAMGTVLMIWAVSWVVDVSAEWLDGWIWK